MTNRFDDILDTSNSIDIEDQYRDMLRECYSDSLSGIFANYDPAQVLQEIDPTAYRCGMNDYVDSMDWEEYDGDYYEISYLEEVRSEAESEIESDIEELESDLEDYDFDGVDEETGEQHRETLEAVVRALRDELVMLYELF
jgi:hypothetical protein